MILKQSAQTISQAAVIIKRGGVIAFRTDTFYGLGADPFSISAVQKIKELKGREANKPILIVISDREQTSRFISDRSSGFNLLAEKFWSGPLTLIGRARVEVRPEVTAGTETVGVRLPGDEEVRDLVRLCGGALTATSANPSGSKAAATAEEVEKYFANEVDLILDSGPAQTDRASTVVDVTGVEPRLIREGVIPWMRIREVIYCGEVNRKAPA